MSSKCFRVKPHVWGASQIGGCCYVMEVRMHFALRIILMPRVLHNTLGCHPLLHTEAHEITHLCASPAARARTARAENCGRARGLAPT